MGGGGVCATAWYSLLGGRAAWPPPLACPPVAWPAVGATVLSAAGSTKAPLAFWAPPPFWLQAASESAARLTETTAAVRRSWVCFMALRIPGKPHCSLGGRGLPWQLDETNRERDSGRRWTAPAIPRSCRRCSP